MSITLPELTEAQRRIWPPHVVASYEAQRQMTDEERRMLVRGFLACLRDKVAIRRQMEAAS